MKPQILLAFFSLLFSVAFGQVSPNRDRQTVLRHNIVGKTYAFDRSKKDNYNRVEITYLGKVKTRDGRIFKILNSRWYWGSTPRATFRIVIYNDKNQYIGNYYMTRDLPSKIENNALLFENNEKDSCNSNISTRISFKNGLPKEFFLECKNKMGDFYSFGDE